MTPRSPAISLVLALYFKLIENGNWCKEEFVSVAGIGCSSRFPIRCRWAAHLIAVLPFASGISFSAGAVHLCLLFGDATSFHWRQSF